MTQHRGYFVVKFLDVRNEFPLLSVTALADAPILSVPDESKVKATSPHSVPRSSSVAIYL
eukprot:8638547-Karenia_brevis.AAC.1